MKTAMATFLYGKQFSKTYPISINYRYAIDCLLPSFFNGLFMSTGAGI